MYEIFARLLKQKGVSVSDVSRATGIRNSTFTDWKMGRTNPKIDKLTKIADYFGVTVEYLTTGADPAAPYYMDDDARDLTEFLHINPEYKVLFDASRKVKKEDIDFVRQMIERTI